MNNHIPPTEAELTDWLRVEGLATPSPWYHDVTMGEGTITATDPGWLVCDAGTRGEGDLIVTARNNFVRLIAEIRRLREVCGRAEPFVRAAENMVSLKVLKAGCGAFADELLRASKGRV